MDRCTFSPDPGLFAVTALHLDEVKDQPPMHLWNDYEGTTIAGRWTLGRLLRTEGRSAMFGTTEADGSPAVMRLTEALNDQAVLSERFALIQRAGDTNLVAVRHFGDAEFDGTPLSYAVLEPTQESLAEIISDRRLAPEEALEVATSVAAGLASLHALGLVHGHVEPESVLAAGDRIKLRSDCARPETPPQDAELEGAITRRTDAVALAGLLYRALTQKRLQDAADALALPEPFASVVRNTLRNANWGIPEIQAELTKPARAVQPAAATKPAPAATPAAPAATKPAAPRPPAIAPATSTLETTPATAKAPARETPRVTTGGFITGSALLPAYDEEAEKAAAARKRNLFIGVAALIVLLLLFLAFHHSGSKPQAAVVPAEPTAAATPVKAAVTTPAPAPEPAKKPVAAPIASPAATPVASVPAGQPVWRVIAYDYNREQQATQKAAAINQRFPGYNAAAWSRNGHRPFLVTLGGPMTQKQAFALRAKAIHAGIARDAYAQNYKQ